MKKIFTLAMLLFSIASYAQGNLQFNQVLNIKNGDNYTVPAGKVLKITAINSSSKTTFKIPFTKCDYFQGQVNCAYSLENVFIGSIGNLNFNLYSTSNFTGYGYGYVSQCSQCPPTFEYIGGNTIGITTPLWLKAGENITIAQGSGVLISAIEFNIIP